MRLDDFSTWLFLFEISQWIVRIIMFAVVPLRRSPQAASAWLLLILFFPWPGLMLYLIIGRHKLPGWRQGMRLKFVAEMQPVLLRLEAIENVISPPLNSELEPAAALAENLGSFRILDGNTVELLKEYQPALDRLVDDIDAATHHVHLFFYIFAADSTTERVIQALERARKRNVEARVMVDDYGSRSFLRKLMQRLHAAEIIPISALPMGFRRVKATRFDLRNHRKIAVIDGRVAYTGSQNLVDPEFKKGLEYEELMVRVTGPVVHQLQLVFLADWHSETDEALSDAAYFPTLPHTGEIAAQVLPSGPSYDTENNEYLIISLLYSAQRRIVITTPYFIPDESFLQALKIAVHRGVEVKVVFPAQMDQFLVGFAQESYYEEMLDAGVEVYRYQPRFLHAKHLTVDDELTLIGSSNVDLRSFRLNEEVSLLSYDAKLAAEFRAEQERYFANSKQLTLEKWQCRSRVRRLLQSMARLVSPLL